MLAEHQDTNFCRTDQNNVFFLARPTSERDEDVCSNAVHDKQSKPNPWRGSHLQLSEASVS
jgi:hypothetical protein